MLQWEHSAILLTFIKLPFVIKIFVLSIFIPHHFKKCRVLCYTLHSKNYVWVSVCLYICPSVGPPACPSVRPSAHRFHYLLGAFFNQFSSNLIWEFILGRSVLSLQMGKFWQISTELRPLINVWNWFSLSIFGIPLPIFFKLGMRVDIVKECSRIADG